MTNPRSEGRNPKAESERSRPAIPIRISALFRPSGFGLGHQAVANLLRAQPLALVQNLIASFIWPHCEQRERSTSGSSV